MGDTTNLTDIQKEIEILKLTKLLRILVSQELYIGLMVSWGLLEKSENSVEFKSLAYDLRGLFFCEMCDLRIIFKKMRPILD